MPIRKGSRYTNTPIVKVDHDGVEVPTLLRRKNLNFPPNAEYIRYQYKAGDSLDYLAFKHLGSANYWWAILDANPTYMTPMDIKVGDFINIPTPDTLRRVLNVI